MPEYKTFEELKEDLGDNYDKFMYEMNLELLKQKNKAIDIIDKIKKEVYKNQFEFTFYDCWLNIKGILESEMK